MTPEISAAMPAADTASDANSNAAASFLAFNNTEGDDSEMNDEMSTRAVITKGMTLTGDLQSDGDLDFRGTMNGNITIQGKLKLTGNVQGNSKAADIIVDESVRVIGDLNSDGNVSVGKGVVAIGNISASSATISGAVQGDIDVQGPVILEASAIVMGNIKSKSVQINNGAVVEGMCSQTYADVNPTAFFEEFKK